MSVPYRTEISDQKIVDWPFHGNSPGVAALFNPSIIRT
jgi:hypothetical protein